MDAIESANIHWYIMRPIMRKPPLCTLAQLKDGAYSIDQLADFHEAMDEEYEYERRNNERKAT